MSDAIRFSPEDGFTCVKVDVPATSANLGPGFDSLAVAWDLSNRFTVQLRGGGEGEGETGGMSPQSASVNITACGEGAEAIALDDSNLFFRAFCLPWRAAGRPVPKVGIHIDNAVPFGQGLGSSATAVVAGVVAANALLGEPFGLERLLEFAHELEPHPDNISAALLGGLVACGIVSGRPVARKLPVAFSYLGVLVVPDFAVKTSEARRVLPKQVPFSDAIFNINRVCLLLTALMQGEKEQLWEFMKDRLHQNYRAHLVPGLQDCLERAGKAGALAAAVSGAGPTVLALVENESIGKEVGEMMRQAFLAAGHEARVFIRRCRNDGVRVVKG